MEEKMLFNLVKFRTAVNQSKYKIAEIAAEVPCSLNTMYRYMRGESPPRPRILKRLVEILGPSIVDLKKTELKLTTDKKQKSNYNEKERQCIQMFMSLSSAYSRARVLSAETALYEFGFDADLKFAADLGGALVREQEQQAEQTG